MQTLSDMQRSITYKRALKYALWSLAYWLYIALSGIYPLLPPLFGLLYYLFYRAKSKQDSLLLLFVVVDIFVLEAQKGFLPFTLLVYFLLFDHFLMYKIKQSINSKHLRNLIIILSIYGGYMLFSAFLAQIFLLALPSSDLYIFYYIVVEFLIVSLML